MSTPKKAPKKKAAALQVIKSEDQDVIKGQQLTAQYERASGAMREIIICGAMMMQLREDHPELAKRGGDKKSKSTVDIDPAKEPLTLQKWLDKYAPKVKRTTAIRFLNVAESVCSDYAKIVGPQVAKQFSLQALVTTPADKLPANAKAKQLTLFEFVSGTSQRSWLDRFAPESPQQRGRDNRNADEKPRAKTATELKQDAENEMNGLLTSLDAWFLAGHHTRIEADLRTTADATLEEARKKIKAVK
ncbi:MAG: hypothetical protein K9N47_21150 [Prosthecobacter sp.]|uniref:hypothetical protein n=1 Tax=Prosthecobacter sp. TaxID=1965333 RepID=UPI00262CE8EC|nr:hypothetical protein [Prosthecobacter sp.]MCF7788644.1 hypothetical protein [Prosthecobacter sp.]